MAATKSTTIKNLGFFDGEGTSHSADPGFLGVLSKAATMAFGGKANYRITKLDTGAKVAAVKPGDFDVLVFPGGSGNGQATALGESGLAAVRAFVTAGGGYIGTCGGAFLGIWWCWWS